MTLLEISGLSRSYGDHQVISALDLSLSPGEAVALVGPNGSGKSTLLRCVAGADQATAGSVMFDGQTYDERSPSIRRDVATLLDDLDFFPDLAVVEHLDLVAHAHGVHDAEKVVDGVLHDIGLINQAPQLPASLSSGQRQRLALGLTLVRPRRLLLLDEPEQRLDTDGVTWLARTLTREKQRGTAVLFACHQRTLVDAVADHAVQLTP